jgi:SARP family transcriptional regulator, regulator of embCAB operon
LKICVLGPLSLRIADSSVTPSAMQPRKMIALLAINANQFVSVADLYAELWQEHLPPSAKVTLQGYVVRLRKILAGQAGCQVITRPGGYLMRVEQGVLDLRHFEEVLAEARQLRRSGQDEPAVQAFRAALAMRRGPVLADIEAGPVLEPSIVRITQACDAATEQLMGCELRLGRHLDILDELAELVMRNPLNEGLHARFMIALYRSGRRGMAIDAYERLRRALAAALGLDPTPGLRRLHLAILQEDPLLEVPQAAGPHRSLEQFVA